MIIDHARLQGAAWAEFYSARKRLDKAARDLHRHEEIDSPAYDAWLHRTFPLLVTRVRELNEELALKTHKVQTAQAMAAFTGRSPKRLWREQKAREANPPGAREDPGFEDDPFSASGEDGDQPFEPPAKPAAPPAPPAVRDIYRRLVQLLHPDRGGAWTAARQRLWHEVQQAWALRDGDWLSRLEIEWECANEVLGPSSPLSRLRRGIEELLGARRDIERKLRAYRLEPQWRFTLSERKRSFLHRRIDAMLNAQLVFAARQLKHLDNLIAAWEEDWTHAGARVKAGRRRRGSF
ncbi:MAG: hypothetical protein RIQ93_3477 [Verrucomicrobiota bacterium]